MYKYRMCNLEAELTRCSILRKDIAQLWNCEAATVYRKMDYMTFTVMEAKILMAYIEKQHFQIFSTPYSSDAHYLFFENVIEVKVNSCEEYDESN